ncbi:ESPR-type extended signal peptide-containing protein [Phascolarctobacterium succinatutens]|uniref:ESPR-type extended signal peptide-containing protein n=1 Tax=Phascolarctobacterium succinatutens TaxID=626940 RepID=UPI0026F1D248|nr:ESPR-type extended signal peptide-containing protein [Phascolarctobacterium succinatutens]MBS5425807.1 S-layer homology domain-containing protein [Phascolarctobacterium succinatutens]
MNKVFKVIWSEARNAYVVVSEIAKNHGSKSCSTKKLLTMLIATGVMTCASMAPAMAGNPAPNDANKGWNLSVNGAITAGTEVQPGDYVDFNGDQNVSVSKDVKDGVKIVKVELNKDIDVNSVQTNALNSKYNLSVGTAADNGIMPFFVSSTGAFYGAHNKFSVDKDGNVNANSIQTNALNSKYNLSVGTAADNGIMPFFVSSTGAFYAAGNKFSVDKDGKVIAPEAEINKLTAKEGVVGNVVLKNGVFYKNSALRDGELFIGDNDGNYSQITPKSAKLGQVTIDEKGNIAGVNSIQTNALNAKYNLSVGTANENGTVPFFVNSNGAFYAANGKLVVDKDGKLVAPEAELGKVTADEGVIGNVVLKDGVFYKHTALRDGELFVGDADGNYSQITTKGAKLGKVTVAADGKISGVAAGAVTADSTDAVNGSQLHAVATEAGKHSKVVNGSNINVEEFDNDGQKIYKVSLNKDIMLGDLTGKYVSISGTNGTIETTGYIATKDRVYADKGGKLADIDVTGNKISNGASSIVLDGSNVKVNDKVTIDQNGKISGVAAGEISSTSTDAINGSQLHQTNENVAQNKADIAQNKADIAQNKADIAANRADIDKNKADIAQNKTDIKNLDNRVTNVEELAKKHTTVTAGDNITVTEDKNKDGGKEYKVALDKDINLDSVTTGQTVMNNDGLKVGDKVSVTAGKTSISDEGVKVGDKTYISADGLNANDQKVTNVKAGDISETSKDAVNGSQLYKTNQEVVNNTNRINQLGSRVNKVGAGAAALAALHPMDFDPDDKLTFSAGYGNYAGENAAAIGAYYRPDEKVMFSVAGTVGNGENMVNAGVSFALDRTNHVSNSRTALAREVIDLRGQLAVMGAKMAKMEKAFGMLDETKTKLFPDVPANHWAYEYIAKLAGNGYIEGYPDGNFGGDRLMTRYEFAAMLYRAIENGAALEEKIIKEFEPELGRIRVDRISGEDGDRDKIERVRVNDTKGERDHYGNKLAK